MRLPFFLSYISEVIIVVDTFKPQAPVNVAPEFNCGNCVHAVKERMPQQLVSQLVCHANPPQAVCVPASNSSYKIMTLFPMVQPQQFCHQHRLKEENRLTLDGV